MGNDPCPYSSEDSCVDCCEDFGGACGGCSCELSGFILGIWSMGATTICLLVLNEKKKILPDNVAGPVISINAVCCLVGGLIGGSTQTCVTNGLTSAFEGSITVLGMVVAMTAL